MRRRVSSLTVGLPRKARETVDCETPARYAMSIDVALAGMAAIMGRHGWHCQQQLSADLQHVLGAGLLRDISVREWRLATLAPRLLIPPPHLLLHPASLT